MGKPYYDDEYEEDYDLGDDDEPVYVPPRKKKGFNLPMIHLDGMWYDYIMILLLIVLGIITVVRFSDVMRFFLMITLRLIDIGVFAVFLLILVCFVLYLLRKRH